MKLVIETGAQAGAEFEITDTVFKIGRGTENQLTLSDPAVSRNHCEIRQTPDGFELRDLKSANGTFVNEQRVDAPILLRAGDQIRFGETRVMCRARAQVKAAPPREKVVPTIAPRAPAPIPVTIPTPARGGLRVNRWSAIVLIGLALIVAIIIAPNFIAQNNPSPTRASSAARIETQTNTPPRDTLTPTSAITITRAAQTLTPLAITTTTSAPPATVAPTRFFNIEPQVVRPADKTKFTLEERIVFSWLPVTTALRDNEFYFVEVARDSDFQRNQKCFRLKRFYKIGTKSCACSGKAEWARCIRRATGT
ncbi:MAG: FHA domain-containing protein [Chloroflexi bacterium]|nr:FHA domain-containing protein [Chloroflexota bacterium]